MGCQSVPCGRVPPHCDRREYCLAMDASHQDRFEGRRERAVLT